MTSNNDGQQSFEVRIDTDGMRRDAQDIMAQFDNIGKSAVQAGQTIDESSITTGTSMKTLSEAIERISEGMKEWNFDTASDKMSALTAVMREQENVILQNRDKIQEWKEQAQEAFNSGDMEGFSNLTNQIIEAETEIKSLISETEDYAVALEAVKAATAEGGVGTMEPIRLYDSEADLIEVESLKERIASLNTEIRKIGAEGGDTSALQDELDGATAKLNEMESAAADTAARLGNDLAGRAAEAQQNLHELNQAIEKQQDYISELSDRVDEAKTAWEEISATEDANSNAVLQAKANYDQLNQSLINAQGTLSALQGAQVDAQTQWQSMSAEVESHDSIIVKMLGGYQNYTQILGQLPGPLQSVIGGINGMTGAAKAFIATPLGAIIAAIVLALQALKTWFDSTVEGQLAFAEVSGYVSGILGQLKEIVISVGQAIYKAFTDPKKALSDFWQALKQNVVNRVKAVGQMFGSLGKIISAVFDMDADGIKSGLKNLANDFLQLNTGVENVTDKIGEWADKTHEAAKATAEISRQTKELDIEVSEWGKRNQELEKLKAQAQAKMYDTSASAAQRKQALEDYKAALQEQTDTEKAFAQRRIDLQKRSMDLTSNTIEDENKLRELETQYLAVETRQEQALASLQRRANSINRSGNTAANKADKADANSMAAEMALSNYDKQIIKQQREIGFEMEQARIDGMQEGFEKTLAQNELNYKKLKADNDDKAEKMVADYREKLMAEYTMENPNATQSEKIKYKLKLEAEITTENLPKEVKEMLNQYDEMATQAYNRANKEVLDQMLKDVLTYEQQREKIIKEYAEREELLYDHDERGNRNGLRKGVTQGNVEELQRQQQEALQQVDQQFAAREETYKIWCNQIANLSLEQLNQVLEQAKKNLEELEQSGTADSKQIATARAKVDTAQKAVNKAAAKEDATAPGARTLKQWQNLYEVLNNVEGEFRAMGSAFDGAVGEIISKSGQVAASAMQMVNGIMQLTQFSITATKMAAEGASASIIALEKASVILTIISAAIQLATMVASLFGNSDKKYEKKIEKLQEQIDALQESYDRLGKAVDKAYSKDAAKLIQQQQTMLKQQQALIRQQIVEEQKKKKSDDDRIKEWQKELREIDDRLKELEEDAKNAIFGEDIQSAIENFADAYESMFDDGINKAKASKDIVKSMIKNMIVEAMKMDISAPMEKLRQMMMQFWADGYISQWEQEQLNKYAEGIMGDLEQKYGWADSYFKESTSQNSSKGGFTAMSQDTAEELNGRFTALQMSNETIKMATIDIQADVKGILTRIALVSANMEEVRGIALIAIDYLESISKHTSHLPQMNERLRKIEDYTSRI